MMSTSRSWRRAAVGVFVCACATIAPRACANAADAVSSLSGHVYLDTNGNHKLDLGQDWAIKGALVTLTREGDSSFLVSVRTDKYGFYDFDGPSSGVHTGLTSGIYDLTLKPYTAAESANNGGEFQSLTTGLILAPTDLSDLGTTGSDGNSFRGIKVAAGMAGTNYNFGKAQYPLELVSKQMLLSTSDPPQYSATPQPPVINPPLPTPEPATCTLLAAGGFGLAMAALARRRKRRNISNAIPSRP